MSLETDLLIDRRRLKRRLLFWRLFAIAAVAACALVLLGRAGGLGGARVARLTVSGIITEDRRLTEALDDIARDRGVRALLVVIDSPGGSVAGGESLHDAIARVAAVDHWLDEAPSLTEKLIVRVSTLALTTASLYFTVRIAAW